MTIRIDLEPDEAKFLIETVPLIQMAGMKKQLLAALALQNSIEQKTTAAFKAYLESEQRAAEQANLSTLSARHKHPGKKSRVT